MLAYNLNCWLVLFNREPQTDATELQHTTLATARLRFLFVAAKIWRHAGRTGVSYSDHYEEKGVFERLMDRLRKIAPRGAGYAPVLRPSFLLSGCSADPSAAVHRNLCTACKRNGARDFGAGFGENGLSGGRCNSENRTDLLNYGRHQASETGARNANRVHNSGETPRVPLGFVLLDRLLELPAREQLQHLRKNAAYFH